MKSIKNLLLLFLCSTVESKPSNNKISQKENRGQIILPVVDVRAHPNLDSSGTHRFHDFNQTTQLLWGEEVVIINEKNKWLNIRIPSPTIFCRKSKKQLSCAGWIPKNSIVKIEETKKPAAFIKMPSAQLYNANIDTLTPELTLYLGTPLQGYQVDETWWRVEGPDQKKLWIKASQIRTTNKNNSYKTKKKLRSSLLKTGMFFLNAPYCWGSRSIYQPNKQNGALFSSVDCSSLIQLIYQAHGITIPRNSTGQYHASKHINGNQLLPGDLIFISHNKSADDIFHVMLYLGNNQLLEALGEKRIVRIVSAEDKLKTSINQIKNGKKYKKHYIFCGSFLS